MREFYTETIEKTNNDFIYFIRLARVISTLLIILCHLSTILGYVSIGLVFDVGVQVFLLISGFLYGRKQNEFSIRWLFYRCSKIMTPIWIWGIILLLNSLYATKSIKGCLIYFLGLNGLGKIYPLNYNYLYLSGHLWFITPLLLCYIGVFFLKKYENRKKHTFGEKELIAYFIGGNLILLLAAGMHFCIEWFLIYFLGYFLAKEINKISWTLYLCSTFGMIFGICFRLLGKYYFDGSWIYDGFIVFFGHNLIAIWIFFSCSKLCEKKVVRSIVNSKFFVELDGLSYYLYIVHYSVLYWIWNIRIDSVGLIIILFGVISIVCSLGVKYFNDLVYLSKIQNEK